MFTAEVVRSLLNYDPLTGIFVWVQDMGRTVRAGDVAGTPDCYGYNVITINRKGYKAHRLAWLYVYGEMPPSTIDHVNGERSDNRIANLRKADLNQNRRNTKKHIDNASGFKGVVFQKHTKRNPWRAVITLNRKSVHLGNFDTPEKAHAAYVHAAKLHFGEFARAA